MSLPGSCSHCSQPALEGQRTCSEHLGACRRCTSKAEEGRTLCIYHQEKQSEYNRAHYKRHKKKTVVVGKRVKEVRKKEEEEDLQQERKEPVSYPMIPLPFKVDRQKYDEAVQWARDFLNKTTKRKQ